MTEARQSELNTIATPSGVAEGVAAVAWMRMMGAESVDYHRATVLARGDDNAGQALAYDASRGETPLLWGGRGAKALGLEGAVTDAQYEALFGPDGACDPTTCERLVHTRRPRPRAGDFRAQVGRRATHADSTDVVALGQRGVVAS
jgi:hypothetical protein